MGAEVFLTFEAELDFVTERDFIFVEEDPFEVPLVVALLFPPDRMLVILPRVELVLLDFVRLDVFGMFLTSGVSALFGLEIFTLPDTPESETFGAIALDDFLVNGVLSFGLFRRIVLLLSWRTTGWVLTKLSWPMPLREYRLRATLEMFLALS